MPYYKQTQIGGEVEWTEIGTELTEEHKNKNIINISEKDYKERVSKHPSINRVYKMFLKKWIIIERKFIWNTSPQPFMEKSKWILAYDETYKNIKIYITKNKGYLGGKLGELAWGRSDPSMINHSSIEPYLEELLNFMCSNQATLVDELFLQELLDLYNELKEEQEMEEVNAPSPETLIIKIGISKGTDHTKVKIAVTEIPDEIKKIFKNMPKRPPNIIIERGSGVQRNNSSACAQWDNKYAKLVKQYKK